MLQQERFDPSELYTEFNLKSGIEALWTQGPGGGYVTVTE